MDQLNAQHSENAIYVDASALPIAPTSPSSDAAAAAAPSGCGDFAVQQPNSGGVDAAPALATATTTAAPPLLQEHSNTNLLKVNTHDKYSTVGAIKKYIAKQLPPPATQAPPLPLFRGMQRIGKNPKNPHIFLAFETLEDRDEAAKQLCTMLYRKQQWVEEQVSDRDLQLTHKGKQRDGGGDGGEGFDDDSNDRGNKRQRSDAADQPQQGASSSTLSVNQWADVPLNEQRERKSRHCLSVMKKILQPNHHNGFVAYRVRFQGVYTSPVTEGYRNHVNFTYGHSATGQPVLGFNEGSLVDGKASVQQADERAVTTSPSAMVIAKACQRLLDALHAESDGHVTVADRATGSGFWRRLQVRENVLGELMLCFEVNPTSGLPSDADDGPFSFNAILHRIVATLTQNASLADALHAIHSTSRVVSIQYYAHAGTTSPPFDVARTVVYGVATLTEQLQGLCFDLGPAAFFQVNTPAFDMLLQRVKDVANLSSNKTVLLDLCCGTGTIGLCLAKHVKKVIGIELIASAVENARANAVRNGVANASFLAGRVETLLPDVINGLTSEDRTDIVAILDPPRAGVHTTVLKWIRSTESIRRVVYISCEQRALETDCPGLTKPATNTYRGEPFVIESGFGVDLFPHTPHVEMIVVLNRGAASSAASPRDTATSTSDDVVAVTSTATASNASAEAIGAPPAAEES